MLNKIILIISISFFLLNTANAKDVDYCYLYIDDMYHAHKIMAKDLNFKSKKEEQVFVAFGLFNAIDAVSEICKTSQSVSRDLIVRFIDKQEGWLLAD